MLLTQTKRRPLRERYASHSNKKKAAERERGMPVTLNKRKELNERGTIGAAL